MPYRIVSFYTGMPNYTACWPRHKGVNKTTCVKLLHSSVRPTDRPTGSQTRHVGHPTAVCLCASVIVICIPVTLNSLQSAFWRRIYATAMGISTSRLFRRCSSTVQSLRNADCDSAAFSSWQL